MGTATKPATRCVGEFLIAEGLATSSRDDVFARWVSTELATLKPQIQAELHVWVRALHGNGSRRRIPMSHSSIRSYFWAVRGPLAAWTLTYHSLREVTVDDVNDQLAALSPARRGGASSSLRSLFSTLKAERVIFADPARRASSPKRQSVVLALEPSERARLLAPDRRPDEQLMALLAGVHALRTGSIRRLRVSDVNVSRRCLTVDGTTRALDALSAGRLMVWLNYRTQRWPQTANPHLLINTHTANTLDPIGKGSVGVAFRKLGLTVQRLRVDRFLDEVHNGSADAVRFARLFDVAPITALRYCADSGLPGPSATGRGPCVP